MTLTGITEQRDAIVASPEPLVEKLPRIDELVRAAGVMARRSPDPRVRQVFDELLDLYIALSGDALAGAH
jgi:hypothetical protein